VLSFLERTWVLVVLFLAMMLVGYSFSFVQEAIGGQLLDMISSSGEVLARLREMTPEQKQIHLWATLTLDTAYPLAYGGLFAGLVWRFAGSFRRWFIVPVLAVIATDLSENAIQVMALAGDEALIGLKDIFTPAKFGLFLLSLIAVIGSFVVAGVRRFQRS